MQAKTEKSIRPAKPMSGNSPQVVSNQQGIHDQLGKVVLKHLQHPFQKPIADFNREAFQQLQNILKEKPDYIDKLIFDSGCGVGESTARLAQLYPDHLIVGLDQSAHRTGKHHAYQNQQVNYLILRAECGDFWRLTHQAGLQLQQHYLLYPNPWPKRYHLQKRWHGSPSFPDLLKLGGKLILRSNWKIYLQEFAQALELTKHAAMIEQITPSSLQTPHERKYHESGHTLWQLDCQLKGSD